MSDDAGEDRPPGDDPIDGEDDEIERGVDPATDDGVDGATDGPVGDAAVDDPTEGGPREDDGRAADDPFADLEEPDGDVDSLFTEIEADDVDAEAVWAELDAVPRDGDTNGSDADHRSEEPVGDAVVGEPTGDEAIVSKATYCQRCEHFSGPPDVGCGNPGTEIVGLEDVKHFRVRNCPVVARRRGATVTELEGGPDDESTGRVGDGTEARDPDPEGGRDAERADERLGGLDTATEEPGGAGEGRTDRRDGSDGHRRGDGIR